MAEAVQAEYFKNFHSTISRLRLDDRTCDVAVHVGEKIFKCHRLVLIAASEYFHIMFGGNFAESSSPEVVLRGLDASVFEVMLSSMYTGVAVITNSDLYDIIRAADFYHLPNLVELCVVYIRENLNAVAENIWKIFLYARIVGIKQIVELLGRHIYVHFGYFSNAPEFVELSVDILLEILGVGAEGRIPLCQDVLFEGIYTWIMRQENLNPDAKKSYFDRLREKINLSRLSKQYTKYKLSERVTVLASLSESTDRSIHVNDVAQSCPKLLRAYVSVLSADRLSSMGTIIFSGFSRPYPSWMYSGKVVDCYSKYMENIVIEDGLYSLGYSSGRHFENPHHTFRRSNSFSMYPYTSLRLPPFVAYEYDMCGNANEIFVYLKSYPISTPVVPGQVGVFHPHRLYSYKRDIDNWFPLPRPKFDVSFASMVCDEGRLYLVGGNSTSNLVQAYDVRAREWSNLPCTKYRHFDAGCCIYDKEIYLADGPCVRHFGEIYNPTSGQQRPLIDIDHPRAYPNLVNYSDSVLNYYRKEEPDESKISLLQNAHGRSSWVRLPYLKNAIKSVRSTRIIPESSHLRTLNMVTF